MEGGPIIKVADLSKWHENAPKTLTTSCHGIASINTQN
jgi:hypothetical protein